MKKLLAVVLAMLTVFSFGTVAFAANTTTLTTTVPDAEYTLNIPADQEIPFGATSTDIGNVTVTNASGFAVGKNLNVTMTYDKFTSEDVATTIPFTVSGKYFTYYSPSTQTTHTSFVNYESGAVLEYFGLASGDTESRAEAPGRTDTSEEDNYKVFALYVNISSENWGKALGGDYTATITFTAEVVAA